MVWFLSSKLQSPLLLIGFSQRPTIVELLLGFERRLAFRARRGAREPREERTIGAQDGDEAAHADRPP